MQTISTLVGISAFFLIIYRNTTASRWLPVKSVDGRIVGITHCQFIYSYIPTSEIPKVTGGKAEIRAIAEVIFEGSKKCVIGVKEMGVIFRFWWRCGYWGKCTV